MMKFKKMNPVMLSLLLVGVFFASNTQDAAAFFCGAGCTQGSTEVTKTAADNDGVSERVTTYKMDNGETVTSTRTFNSRTNSETVTDSTGKRVTNYYGGGGGGVTTEASYAGVGVRDSVSKGTTSGDLKKMIEDLQKRVEALTKQIQNKKTTTKTSNNSNTGSGIRITKNMGVGSRGDAVLDLQQCLKDLGHFNGDMANTFGPQTRNAVKSFQRAEGIVSSGTEWSTGYGYVGPQTRNKLNNKCGNVSTTQTSNGTGSSGTTRTTNTNNTTKKNTGNSYPEGCYATEGGLRNSSLICPTDEPRTVWQARDL